MADFDETGPGSAGDLGARAGASSGLIDDVLGI
jgi:hypothetical protein